MFATKEGVEPRAKRDMSALQEAAFQTHSDYAGSPHLMHMYLREAIVADIRRTVLERLDKQGSCNVLEIGAGHGNFTDHALACGASVTVTEASRAALSELKDRLKHNSAVSLIYSDGESLQLDDDFDVILCLSVLHHIPDYLSFLAEVLEQLRPGGSLLSYQDPLHHSRRSRANLRVDRGAFLFWRVRQGRLGQGIRTQLRRVRGVYDESLPEDMSEYHVVRRGVDEDAIAGLLKERFREVELVDYWSTPSALLQSVGTRLKIRNTFAVTARGKIKNGTNGVTKS